jgi:Uma2 family endonuclease
VSTLDHLADLAPERVRPLKRVEFERLIEAGVFGEDEKIELLDGVLVEMSPQDPAHAGTVERLAEALFRAASAQASVRVQLPFAASDDSLPEPDVALVARADHRGAHPRTAFLVAEVSIDSLRKDRGLKADLYARAGVPEYWVVNVAQALVERHTSPLGGRYSNVEAVSPGRTIRLVALPAVEISVSDVVG